MNFTVYRNTRKQRILGQSDHDHDNMWVVICDYGTKMITIIINFLPLQLDFFAL